MNTPPDKGGGTPGNGTSAMDMHMDMANENGRNPDNNQADTNTGPGNVFNSNNTADSRSQAIPVVQGNTKTMESSKCFNLEKPLFYSESVYVFIEKVNEENIGRLHPMYVGHILHKKLNIQNITSIEKVGRNRIKVSLKNIIDANKLVMNPDLILENMRAYIPNNLLTRKGIIRGVDTMFNEEYLLNNIISSSTVTEVKRFKRKINIDGEPTEIPRQTILLTFEGNKLPANIEINSVLCPVVPYIQKVIQCYKCLRYGHVAIQCRSTTTLCINCSKEKINDQHTCRDPQDSFCMYCKIGNHKSIAKQCPIFEKQKKIKDYMANSNLTFIEAKKIIEYSYATAVSTNNRYDILDTRDVTNFPPLRNTLKTKKSPPTRSESFSQPSTSANHPQSQNLIIQSQQNKKRKAQSPISLTPPTAPMFPFRQGPKNPLPPNPYRPEPSDRNKSKMIEDFSNLLQNLVSGINSLEDLKNINEEVLREKMSSVLEYVNSNNLNIQSK